MVKRKPHSAERRDLAQFRSVGRSRVQCKREASRIRRAIAADRSAIDISRMYDLSCPFKIPSLSRSTPYQQNQSSDVIHRFLTSQPDSPQRFECFNNCAQQHSESQHAKHRWVTYQECPPEQCRRQSETTRARTSVSFRDHEDMHHSPTSRMLYQFKPELTNQCQTGICGEVPTTSAPPTRPSCNCIGLSVVVVSRSRACVSEIICGIPVQNPRTCEKLRPKYTRRLSNQFRGLLHMLKLVPIAILLKVTTSTTCKSFDEHLSFQQHGLSNAHHRSDREHHGFACDRVFRPSRSWCLGEDSPYAHTWIGH